MMMTIFTTVYCDRLGYGIGTARKQPEHQPRWQ